DISRLYRHREIFNQPKKPLAALLTMVWMRSDVDLAHTPVSGFRSSKARFWRLAVSGMFVGMLSVLALALLDAPVYAYALVLLAWGTALALWLRGDVEAALPPTSTLSKLSDLAEQAAEAAAAKTPEPRWQNWVAGWYWETDAEGVLRTFSPGAEVAPELKVDWTALTAFVRSRPLWVSCWAAPGSDADQGDEDRREGL